MRSNGGRPEGRQLRVQLYCLSSTCLPINGYHQACGMWPVPDSYFPVLNLPPNKRVPVSTTVSTLTRIDLLSGFAEKFAETDLLVSSKVCSMAWPDLILFGLV